MTQGELPFGARQREAAPVSAALIVRQPTMLSALQLSQTVSGLDDKQIYSPLGVDHAQWSRIKTGGANFPVNQLCEFMRLTGNHIPLVWLAHQMGYELRPLLSTLEQQLEAERGARQEAERELAIIKKFMRETR